MNHAYSLIRKSTGLCVAQTRECPLESVSSRRKRSVEEEKAYAACDQFIVEAQKTVKQLLGNLTSRLIHDAREACVTDVLSTDNRAVVQS